MRFAKGHGTGNDFVILPDPDDELPLPPPLIRRLCDRRTGIGGDGVLRVVRADGQWFMDFHNADGSEGETCGNGLRVFARFLVDSGFAEPGSIPILTRAGGVVAVVEGDSIAVDLGLPKLYGESTATVDERVLVGTAVDVGNPHLACEVVELSTLDLSEPPEVDTAFFPAGVNVEFFVPVDDMHAMMRVYERGVGETRSCGTGAAAVAAVVLRDAGRTEGTVTVDVPGGTLRLTFDGTTCWLSGPAVIVAQGETSLTT